MRPRRRGCFTAEASGRHPEFLLVRQAGGGRSQSQPRHHGGEMSSSAKHARSARGLQAGPSWGAGGPGAHAKPTSPEENVLLQRLWTVVGAAVAQSRALRPPRPWIQTYSLSTKPGAHAGDGDRDRPASFHSSAGDVQQPRDQDVARIICLHLSSRGQEAGVFDSSWCGWVGGFMEGRQ